MRHGKGGHLEKKPGDLGFETRKLAISYRNSQLRAIAAAIATQSPFILHVRAYVADADPGSTSENVLPLKAIVLRDVDH